MQGKPLLLFFKCVFLAGLGYAFLSFSNPLLDNSRYQTWKIEKITYSYSKAQNGSAGIAKSGTETNAGTFIFYNDNTGSYSYVIDGMERKGTFKQSESSLKTFMYSSGENQNEPIIQNTYTVIEGSANMEINVKEMTVDQGMQFALTAVFHLSK